MTAGLFHLHGVWIGRCRDGNLFNRKGYFENLDIKALLKRVYTPHLRIAAENIPAPIHGFVDEVNSILQRSGYLSGKWLCKHSALYWQAWQEFKPQYICVRRNTESVINSNAALSTIPGDAKYIIQRHNEEMDIVVEKHAGRNVYADQLINGDYSSLQCAMDACNITLNKRIADDFISPDLWHY